MCKVKICILVLVEKKEIKPNVLYIITTRWLSRLIFKWVCEKLLLLRNVFKCNGLLLLGIAFGCIFIHYQTFGHSLGFITV